ncbi:Sugar ABC transporter ATPase [Pararobbsia alpina]|uniref:sugar ABC transporter ATPase n=1 Tax=Pararobbsia alpina TaxID=621374 RepID=UPI0039A57BFC
MTKTLLVPAASTVLLTLATLAGCSSPGLPPPGSASSGLGGTAPMIYVQSARQPDDITSCLQDRASSLRAANLGNAIQLGDGHDWLITLTPSRGGSTVAVQKAANASDRIPEPEMRFDIARCTT